MSLRILVLVGICTAMTLGASAAAAQDNPMVVMETNFGSVTIELFEKEAPISVENFLQYVNDGFYEGLIFHRIIKGFMIQGGGFLEDMTQKRGRPPITNEATNGLSNERGTIAMARTNVVDSATSQFFLNTMDNGSRGLDHRSTEAPEYGYAVFGRITAGMDVVDKIEDVQTETKGPFADVPVEPVIIQSITVQ